MKRSVAWITLASLVLSLHAAPCLAQNADLAAHMAAYRKKVLEPAAEKALRPQSQPAPEPVLWRQAAPLLSGPGGQTSLEQPAAEPISIPTHGLQVDCGFDLHSLENDIEGLPTPPTRDATTWLLEAVYVVGLFMQATPYYSHYAPR